MRATHSAVLNTLTRVQQFLDANAKALAPVNASEYRTELDQAVATLDGHAVAQAISKRTTAAETAKQRKLREALKLNHLRPIARVAEARLRKEPDFVAMRMPPGNATSRRLIAAAGAMGKAATNYTPTFLSSGLATDFLTKLQESTDALSASLAVRGHTVSAGAGATAGLDAEAARGRRALKVLDSLVVPLIADDDALMAQWRSAKRFRGKTPSLALTTAEASGTAAAATGGGEGGVPEGPKPTEGSVAEAVVQATA